MFCIVIEKTEFVRAESYRALGQSYCSYNKIAWRTRPRRADRVSDCVTHRYLVVGLRKTFRMSEKIFRKYIATRKLGIDVEPR